MTGSPKNGFVKIELLVVIGIIFVLTTLLIPALSGAKKRSRQVVCLSHLRQLGLAVGMYADDWGVRPSGMQPMSDLHYLQVAATLMCPEDASGNWGGIYQETSRRAVAPGESAEKVRYSYINNLSWDRWYLIDLLKAGSGAGLAVCQTHGHKTGCGANPSILNFEGLLLRLQHDGAVVKRKVLWRRDGALISADPWLFFSDEPAPSRKN